MPSLCPPEVGRDGPHVSVLGPGQGLVSARDFFVRIRHRVSCGRRLVLPVETACVRVCYVIGSIVLTLCPLACRLDLNGAACIMFISHNLAELVSERVSNASRHELGMRKVQWRERCAKSSINAGPPHGWGEALLMGDGVSSKKCRGAGLLAETTRRCFVWVRFSVRFMNRLA